MAFSMQEQYDFKEGRWRIGAQLDPPSPPDPKAPPMAGFFVAWDPVVQKARWRIPFQPSGGALSTAGQLIVVGNSAGALLALGPATGATLRQHQMLPGVATPITYKFDGR